MKSTWLWSLWQGILLSMALGFSGQGKKRYVEWATGLALNIEEHTITQSLIGLDLPQDWKASESFAEYGAWNLPHLQLFLASRLDDLPNRLWYGYRVWCGDDTKVHRNSADVWGTCTFHNYSARCPNRASTVRAHNWVVTGALVPNPGQAAYFLPVTGQLYFRKSQLPEPQKGPPITFRTKCQLLVEQFRQHANACEDNDLGSDNNLAIFDGGFAVGSVVRPLVKPDDPEQPRIDFVTRLRRDARLHALPIKKPSGWMPKWGKRLPPPKQGGDWPTDWQSGKAFLYGRVREVKYKVMLCQWHVLGHDVVAKVVFALVEGYTKPFTLVSSATDLSGLQIVELFCARFRQEDGFRDLKQRLGWEECRAWTRNPIERTTQMMFVTLTALRLLEVEVQEQQGDDWWLHPPWNPNKSRPSVLDVQRLLWQHREGIQQCLVDWLGSEEKAGA
jgi:Transposase DDE domain